MHTYKYITAALASVLLTSCDNPNNTIALGAITQGAGMGMVGTQLQPYASAVTQTGQGLRDIGESDKRNQAYNTQHQIIAEQNQNNNQQVSANNPNFALCDGEDINASIRGCTALIVSGQGNIPAAYSNRAGAYNKKKQYNKAIADSNEAIRLQPDFAVAYVNRGNAYLNKKQYEKAMGDYDEAIRLKPDLADAYNNRSILEKKMGNTEDSKADFAKAKELGFK